MAGAPRIYARLTRSLWGVGMIANLWLAADHLLLIRSTGYSEHYARMMLRDIKGFFIVPSERRLWWGAVWGMLAAISGVVVVASLIGRETPIASAIFLGIGTLGLVWNHLLGEGCQFYVVTGVQTTSLPALVRIKKARRVLARLQPMIEAAQADLVGAPQEPSRQPPTIEPSAPSTSQEPAPVSTEPSSGPPESPPTPTGT